MSLDQIYKQLKQNAPRKQAYIPSLWLSKEDTGLTMVNYPEFIFSQIDLIKATHHPDRFSSDNSWTQEAVIYNLFVRLFTAFDHDQDGALGDSKHDITLNGNGLRETGTFLKTIALLPYLQRLGINTVHLLPITEIGVQGRKGDLGSPYAIKNPYKIDPNLADPIIAADADVQYKALVEAASLMGMKVVQEFIFRTASVDSDLIHDHPDWFYWIKKSAKYSAPKFDEASLKKIKQIPIGKGEHIPPPQRYQDQFVAPPVLISSGLRIASAFADWPPDDLQPPWTDVTYLRLYKYDYKAKNNFNYIAYNTIRYYDPELAQERNINGALWANIEDIIPYFQKNFGIQGAMIDMGHALPEKLKKNIIYKARKLNPEFAFWDENFENTAETKKEGYNAVIGGAWYNITKRNGFKNQILSLEKSKPLPYFGTPETHNSPRYATQDQTKKMASWVLFNLLPQAIPFLHNGFELSEELPVNTGLNFSKHDLEYLSDKHLALFHKCSLNWNTNKNIIPFLIRFEAIKKSHSWIFESADRAIIHTSNRRVLGITGTFKKKTFIALFNTNFYAAECFRIELGLRMLEDLLTKEIYNSSSMIRLKRGGFIFCISS